MNIYTVYEHTSYDEKRVNSYTSYMKAFKFINNTLNKIEGVIITKGVSFYTKNKEDFTNEEWKEIINNLKKEQNVKFYNKKVYETYSIKKEEVF